MNNPNPFVPQGSLLEQQSKRRSRLKLGVLCVLAVGIAGLAAMLIQGCKREESETDNTPQVDTNVVAATDTNMAPPTDASNLPPTGMTQPPQQQVVTPPASATTGAADRNRICCRQRRLLCEDRQAVWHHDQSP